MIKNNKQIKSLVSSVVLPLMAGFFGAYLFAKSNTKSALNYSTNTAIMPASMTAAPEGFEKASAVSTPSVVFIQVESTVEQRSSFGWFWDFDPFGMRGTSVSTGSGVIISADGYIVTNNHVVDNANKITVVLNENTAEYKATLVGTDPSSDLAILKIDASNLPAISIANSDEVQVGNWVLAVGNPFNLNSTVTAGIVSAKGRNINIVKNQFPMESFIQTDAAINPGNSGGALVNIKGELVGINTAIKSETGSYTGYGFAIPSNVVAKIATDFMKFGKLQKAFLGMDVRNVNASERSTLKTSEQGVLVSSVLNEGKAQKAGILAGDLITSINNKPTHTKAQVDEIVAAMRPGDELQLVLYRGGNKKSISMKLMSQSEYEEIVNKGMVNSKVLGASFQPLSQAEKDKYKISAGVKVRNVLQGSVANSLNLYEGFIITHLNNKEYDDVDELVSALESVKGNIKIQGIGANGQRSIMSFSGY